MFGKLFGSKKVIDAGIKGIDAIVYTDEEKVENKLRFLKAYEPFKVAQRLLALIMGIPYAVLGFLAVILSLCGVGDADTALEILHELFTIPVGLIMGFYFGGGAIEGIVKARGK